MAVDAIEFASILCSRLCHDLLSPVGAINNGIELLTDENDPEMRTQCMDLLGESARTSANKLKFFRLAFGAAGGFGDRIDSGEAKAAIEGLFSHKGRIEFGWLVSAPTLSKPAVKVLLNLAMIAGDALVRGGRLDVGAEEHGKQTDIAIRAEGARIIVDPEVRRALQGTLPDSELTSRTSAAWLAQAIAAGAGGAIQVSPVDAEALLLGATLTAP